MNQGFANVFALLERDCGVPREVGRCLRVILKV